MTKVRSDAWGWKEDSVLKETVIRHIGEGSTQLKAFDEVAEKIERTPAAVGFRWNDFLRHLYPAQIKAAKAKARELKKNRNKPVQQEMILEARPTPKKTSPKPSYVIELDLFSDFEKKDNPEFACNSQDRMMDIVDLFTENGYRAIVKRKRG